MIDRNSPEYQAAKDRVKVSHFTEQNYNITGLVHIGANDGYEIEYYLAMGIKPVLAIEPLDSARKILFQKYKDNPDVQFSNVALGNIHADLTLFVTAGDGKGSSFLREPGSSISLTQSATMSRWGDMRITRSQYNCCVIDVQGMELDVLRGMDDDIKFFDFLSVECSVNPIYKGEATVFDVIRYLDWMGFSCDSNMDNLPAHDDVFFVNRRVKNPPAPPAPVPRGCFLNIGSGQRRFTGEGWINVDCVSRPGQVPDLLLDVGTEKLPYEDNSMDIVVLHQTYEHFGLGEGHGLVRESQRVLKPGGSLIVTVPDMHALADRWLKGELSNYLYFVNVYGAYQGEPGDRHKWGFNLPELLSDLDRASTWRLVKKFDFRAIPGAEIALDWWILGVEAVK